MFGFKKRIKATSKGLALLAFIDSGIIQVDEDAPDDTEIDTSIFDRFWEAYEKLISEVQ